MKIAIAMLCHKNAEQINALLRAMAHDDIYFYIHVDKKKWHRPRNNNWKKMYMFSVKIAA